MSALSNAVILARVSSKAQEDEGYSLDSQLKLLGKYCEEKELNVVKVFKIAETASKEQGRKVFRELLTYIQKEKVYHLAVEKTDRLTRNFRDAVAIDDWLERDANRRLHAVKESLLLHKEAKSDVKFMWNIYLAFAKKYTDNLREEAMKGWAEKLAQGWLPAPPPPGYMTVTESSKRIHVPNPDTAPLMQRVFALMTLPHYSVALMTEQMAIMGLTTSKGKPFAKSHVYTILTNPFYIGTNHFDGKDYPGAQEPIISQKQFDAVQERLHSRKAQGHRKHNPLFKGIVRCADCAGLVTWQLQKGRFYGACQRNTDACKGHRLLREDYLEETVIAMLEEVTDPKRKILGMLTTLVNLDLPQSVGLYRKRIAAELEKQLTRVKAMDEALYEDKLLGAIPAERYDEKHNQFTGRIAEIQERLDRLTQTQVKQQPDTSNFRTKNLIVRLYLQSSVNQKRAIIAKVFQPITMQQGRTIITLRDVTA